KGDFEKFADYTNPQLLKRLGGRDRVIARLKAELKEMRARGATIRSFKVGDPTGRAAAGQKCFALVPGTVVVTVPGAKFTMNSFLVGISEDAGRTWTFLDGAQATRGPR